MASRHPWFEAELLPVLRADTGVCYAKSPWRLAERRFDRRGPFEVGGRSRRTIWTRRCGSLSAKAFRIRCGHGRSNQVGAATTWKEPSLPV